MTPSGETRQVRGRVLSILAGIGFLLSLSAWAVSSPVGSAPDDTYHLPLIWCAWGPHETCVIDSAGAVLIPNDVANICTYQQVEVSAACELAQPEELAISGQIATITMDHVGQTGDHSKVLSNISVFHRTLRLFVGLDSASSAIAMRLANSVLAALLLTWSLLVASPRIRGAIALSWLIISVPVGMFIMSSTNPSSWAVIGVASFWGFALAFSSLRQNHSSQRTWAAIGTIVSIAVALAGRVDTFVFLAPASIAIVILRWPRIRRLRYFWILVGFIAVSGAIILALTSIGDRIFIAMQNLLEPNPSLTDPNLSQGGLDPLVNHLVELPAYLVGFVGGQNPSFSFPTAYQRGLGWLDTSVPSLVGVFVTVAASVAIGWGLQSYNWRKVGALVVVLLALIGSIVIPMQAANFAPTVNLQPRYSLPVLYVILGLSLVTSRSARIPRLGLVAIVLALTFVAQAVASLASLRRYTNGESIPWMRLELLPNWWWSEFPLTPLQVWLVGAVSFGLACIAAGMLWRDRSAFTPS